MPGMDFCGCAVLDEALLACRRGGMTGCGGFVTALRDGEGEERKWTTGRYGTVRSCASILAELIRR